MSAAVARSLDPWVFRQCEEAPGELFSAPLQVLGEDSPALDFSRFVLLSDGHRMKFVHVSKNIAAKTCALRPFDVISAQMISVAPDDGAPRMYLFDYEVLYAHLDEMLGRPVAFETADHDPGAAAVRIPERVIQRSARVGDGCEASSSSALETAGEPHCFAERHPASEETRDSQEEGEGLCRREEPLSHGPFQRISELKLKDRYFTLRVKIVAKEEIRPLKTREGNAFSVKLRDESGSIKGTFGKSTSERFFPLITVGSVYSISCGSVEYALADSLFGYQIIFNDTTAVTELATDLQLPTDTVEAVRFGHLANFRLNATVDVIAMVIDAGAPTSVTLKNGGTKRFRKLRLMDESGLLVETCIWGDRADSLSLEPGVIYHMRELKVKEYRGSRNLLIEDYSHVVECRSDAACTARFRRWAGRNRGHIQQLIERSDSRKNLVISMFSPLELSPITAFKAETDEFFRRERNYAQRKYFYATVFVVGISKKLFYESCDQLDCKKKVAQVSGGFYCEKCQRLVPVARKQFMCDLVLSDASGFIFARAFSNEICRTIFDQSVDSLAELDPADEDNYCNFLKKNYFREYLVKLMLRKEVYDQNSRVSAEVMSIERLEKPDVISKVCISLLSQLANCKDA